MEVQADMRLLRVSLQVVEHAIPREATRFWGVPAFGGTPNGTLMVFQCLKADECERTRMRCLSTRSMSRNQLSKADVFIAEVTQSPNLFAWINSISCGREE